MNEPKAAKKDILVSPHTLGLVDVKSQGYDWMNQ